MSLVQIPVRVKAETADGVLLAGARVVSTLTKLERDGDQLVVRKPIVRITGVGGYVDMPHWPNSRGIAASRYKVEIFHNEALIDSFFMTVPEADEVDWPVPAAEIMNLPAPTPIPGTTDGLTEGNYNKYFTESRVFAAGLATLTPVNDAVEVGDSLEEIVGKLQGQVSAVGGVNITGPALLGRQEGTSGPASAVTAGGGLTLLGGVLAVNLTAADLGLGAVENKSSATIRGEITGGNVTAALGYAPVNPAAIGTAAALASDTDGTLAANSDARLPTQQAVRTAINALLAANDAEVYLGVIDCSANPNYPAASAGHVYRVSVPGKIGGAAGVNVELNDRLQCIVDGTAAGNHATVGVNWWITQGNIDGAVVGPAAATDGHVVLFDGVSGKLVKSSGLTLSGSNSGDENGARIAALLHAATAKAALVDADKLSGVDSASGWSLIGVTLVNVWTYIKSKADLVYGPNTSALATGILRNTTTTGAHTIATGADLPVMTATVGGAVPTPPNNTTTFLRGDGTFAAPAGGGGSSNTRWIGAGELIPRVTTGAGIDAEETTTNKNNLDYLAFDPGTIEYAQATFSWPAGVTTYTAKLYWTAASGSGAVVWATSARCFADDDALDQAMGTAQSVTDTLLLAVDTHISGATAATTPAGTVTAGNLTILQVQRTATDGSDTLAVDARLIGVEVTFA